MRSHLLEGKVRHRRLGGPPYEFEHDVFYIGLDLAELRLADRRLWLFSHRRPNALCLLQRDHFDGRPLVRTALGSFPSSAREQIERVTMVVCPRVFGYDFNPITLYLGYGEGGVVATVAEVHNTFGGRHVYALEGERGCDGAWRASAAKALYVSPFIDEASEYAFTIRDEHERLAVEIRATSGGRPVLEASMLLRRVPLTNARLARALVRYPLMSVKTIAMIHWHALRLWRRGAPFHSRHEVAG